MSDLPTIDDATEAVKDKANRLVDWLPDPHECDCGAYTEATTEYVGEMAGYEDIWKCPDCGARYYRDRE